MSLMYSLVVNKPSPCLSLATMSMRPMRCWLHLMRWDRMPNRSFRAFLSAQLVCLRSATSAIVETKSIRRVATSSIRSQSVHTPSCSWSHLNFVIVWLSIHYFIFTTELFTVFTWKLIAFFNINHKWFWVDAVHSSCFYFNTYDLNICGPIWVNNSRVGKCWIWRITHGIVGAMRWYCGFARDLGCVRGGQVPETLLYMNVIITNKIKYCTVPLDFLQICFHVIQFIFVFHVRK